MPPNKSLKLQGFDYSVILFDLRGVEFLGPWGKFSRHWDSEVVCGLSVCGLAAFEREKGTAVVHTVMFIVTACGKGD